MSLRLKFIAFALIVHGALFLLALQLLLEHKYWFIAAEVLILLSLAFSFYLFKAFVKPLDLISAGVESIRDKDFNTRFITVGQPEMDSLIDVYNRMIDQLREERVKQREQHYFLKQLIDSSPSGILVLDLDGRVSLLNPAAERLLGAGEGAVKGKALEEIPAPLAREMSTLGKDESRSIVIHGLAAFKCHKSHFLDQGFHRHFIVIEELTKEILEAERQSYEKVIRMMSHEVNNSIGAINSILDSALHYRKQLEAEDRADFENALTVAKRRNEHLNRFMSNFADVVRLSPPARKPCDLHALLRSVHTLMRPELKRRNIDWQWRLCDSSPFTVSIDMQQMEQVLVNIVKNAAEAIDRNGIIRIATTAAPAKRLTIRDNGQPIGPETRRKLFTPFFSTKKNGQGIGLTLVREILVSHRFSFGLEETEEGWKEFGITF